MKVKQVRNIAKMWAENNRRHITTHRGTGQAYYRGLVNGLYQIVDLVDKKGWDKKGINDLIHLSGR